MNPVKEKLCLSMPDLPSKLPICNDDPIRNFKILESSPSTVLLSFDNVSNRLTPSFHHSIAGNIFAGEEITLFGLSGFCSEASGIIFSKNVFSSFKSDKVSTPSFNDILNLGPSAMGSDKGRVELARYAIVPPVLIDALCMDELTPADVLGKSIELLETSRDSIDAIFRKIIRADLKKDEANQDQPLSDEEIESQITVERIEELYESSFSSFFKFLWSTCVPTLIEKFQPTFGPLLQKRSIIGRVKELHANCLCKGVDSSDSSFSIEKIQSIIEATTAAVMKTIDLSQKEVHLPLVPSEKEDSKKCKAFTNLDDTRKNLILNLHSDGVSIPSSPCSTCLEILNNKSGPSVASYLNNQFIDEDFAVSKGMCHNLGHGHVFSPTPFEIKNVSPFYVHIRSLSIANNVDQEELFVIEMLNRSNSLSRSDTSEIVKNDLYIATDYHTLKQQLKNHSLIWRSFTSEDSYLHLGLTDINSHLESNADAYREQIASNPDFIPSFLQDIHFRMQNFFKSCFRSQSIDQIRFEFVNFDSIIKSIDMRNYNVNPPVWYKSLIAGKERSSSSGSKRVNNNAITQARVKKTLEENHTLDNACKLGNGETFGDLFNRHALESLPTLPKIQSTHLCLKYHVLGKCFSTCSRRCTHVNLENDKLIELRKFVQEARTKNSPTSNVHIRDTRKFHVAKAKNIDIPSMIQTPNIGPNSQGEKE